MRTLRKNNMGFYENKLKGDVVMKKENKALLEEVINDRLKRALEEGNGEQAEVIFQEAMEAIDRQATLDKDKKDNLVKYVEIGAAILLAPIIEAGCKKAFAKIICEFEKDYTFTTSAGRALSNLFRFKK